MSTSPVRRTLTAALLAAGLAATSVALSPAASATSLPAAAPLSAGSCPDVQVVFARGTGERAGLGIIGRPFARALADELPGMTVTSHAVDYAAAASQRSAGPGATAMTDHVTAMAARCPGTQFVLGGYSQGATVTSIALGIRAGTTTGRAIPDELSDRVAAVVVFGNPLGMRGQTIASASRTYADRAKDYCNSGDSICGRQPSTGRGTHTGYATNGSTTDGARFAAGLVTANPPEAAPPTAPPTTPPTTPAPPSDQVTCVTAQVSEHVEARRAIRGLTRAYARGTLEDIGRLRSTEEVSLRRSGTFSWTPTASC
ncbi:cutinase family protein [Cellulomonas bogoriensis]|uniref:Cutinase n=1 Tax=Cellulomonas bogoriensis 69B4 = DSM 16987 TaxID=1386082 RepID=A0A0A0C009_9CELL|nr:cutinase family protein [Cellulomonas bogoriensis]KGM14008.1 cutinase [Cellulomonas bogoriensis 69B4 = DSM 16987]